MKQALYETAQWIVMIALWLPFIALARGLRAASLFVRRAGDALVRPLYYGVVQAKRRALGLPLWQEQDVQIGIGPPCEHCGVHVPPERHRDDCDFLSAHDDPLPFPSVAVIVAECASRCSEYAKSMRRGTYPRDDATQAQLLELALLWEQAGAAFEQYRLAAAAKRDQP